jgi:hypothetical protein
MDPQEEIFDDRDVLVWSSSACDDWSEVSRVEIWRDEWYGGFDHTMHLLVIFPRNLKELN